MKKEITLELARELGIVPTVRYYVDCGSFMGLTRTRTRTETEYRDEELMIRRKFDVGPMDTIMVEESDIYRAVDASNSRVKN